MKGSSEANTHPGSDIPGYSPPAEFVDLGITLEAQLEIVRYLLGQLRSQHFGFGMPSLVFRSRRNATQDEIRIVVEIENQYIRERAKRFLAQFPEIALVLLLPSLVWPLALSVGGLVASISDASLPPSAFLVSIPVAAVAAVSAHIFFKVGRLSRFVGDRQSVRLSVDALAALTAGVQTIACFVERVRWLAFALATVLIILIIAERAVRWSKLANAEILDSKFFGAQLRHTLLPFLVLVIGLSHVAMAGADAKDYMRIDHANIFLFLMLASVVSLGELSWGSLIGCYVATGLVVVAAATRVWYTSDYNIVAAGTAISLGIGALLSASATWLLSTFSASKTKREHWLERSIEKLTALMQDVETVHSEMKTENKVRAYKGSMGLDTDDSIRDHP